MVFCALPQEFPVPGSEKNSFLTFSNPWLCCVRESQHRDKAKGSRGKSQSAACLSRPAGLLERRMPALWIPLPASLPPTPAGLPELSSLAGKVLAEPAVLARHSSCCLPSPGAEPSAAVTRRPSLQWGGTADCKHYPQQKELKGGWEEVGWGLFITPPCALWLTK